METKLYIITDVGEEDGCFNRKEELIGSVYSGYIDFIHRRGYVKPWCGWVGTTAPNAYSDFYKIKIRPLQGRMPVSPGVHYLDK